MPNRKLNRPPIEGQPAALSCCSRQKIPPELPIKIKGNFRGGAGIACMHANALLMRVLSVCSIVDLATRIEYIRVISFGWNFFYFCAPLGLQTVVK
jgi:hypothetical protein